MGQIGNQPEHGLLCAAAQARGLGVVSLGSKMIDAPVVKLALTTVDTAVVVGKLAAEWRDEEVSR